MEDERITKRNYVAKTEGKNKSLDHEIPGRSLYKAGEKRNMRRSEVKHLIQNKILLKLKIKEEIK